MLDVHFVFDYDFDKYFFWFSLPMLAILIGNLGYALGQRRGRREIKETIQEIDQIGNLTTSTENNKRLNG